MIIFNYPFLSERLHKATNADFTLLDLKNQLPTPFRQELIRYNDSFLRGLALGKVSHASTANNVLTGNTPSGIDKPTVEKIEPRNAKLELAGLCYDSVDHFFDMLDVLETGRHKLSSFKPVFTSCLGGENIRDLLLGIRAVIGGEGITGITKLLKFLREERLEQGLIAADYPIPQPAILSLIYTKLEKAAIECEEHASSHSF